MSGVAQRANSVPAQPIRDLVSEFLRKSRDVNRLGRDAGVSQASLKTLFDSRSTRVDFDVADRLLTAMGVTHLWHSALEDDYLACDLSEHPLVPRAEYTWGLCAGCGEVIDYEIGRSRKFCTPDCALRSK